jgi:hypothetical protein
MSFGLRLEFNLYIVFCAAKLKLEL